MIRILLIILLSANICFAETKKISITIPVDADKAATIKCTEVCKTSYNSIKKELTFEANKATGKKFRLVHDGKTAYIVEGSDKNETVSIFTIEEFDTEKEALDRITKLGLKYETPEE